MPLLCGMGIMLCWRSCLFLCTSHLTEGKGRRHRTLYSSDFSSFTHLQTFCLRKFYIGLCISYVSIALMKHHDYKRKRLGGVYSFRVRVRDSSRSMAVAGRHGSEANVESFHLSTTQKQKDLTVKCVGFWNHGDTPPPETAHLVILYKQIQELATKYIYETITKA